MYTYTHVYMYGFNCRLTTCTCTVEPLYNEVLGTMKITLLYQVSRYIRVKKQRNIKSWDQQNDLVIRGLNRPYAYDVTEGRPAALGVKRNTATCVIAKHAARGGKPCKPHRRAGPPGPAH